MEPEKDRIIPVKEVLYYNYAKAEKQYGHDSREYYHSLSEWMRYFGNKDYWGKTFTTEDVEKAYLNSDAFNMRMCRSLGYSANIDNYKDVVASMPKEHRDLYNAVVEYANSSAVNLHLVYTDKGQLASQFVPVKALQEQIKNVMPNASEDDIEDMKDQLSDVFTLMKQNKLLDKVTEDPLSQPLKENTSLAIYADDSDKLMSGMNVGGHEGGHYLYNSCIGMNPGNNDKGNNYIDATTDYGKKNSPLNKLDSEPIKYTPSFLFKVYKMLPDEYRIYGKPANSDIKQHDNAGTERGADVHGVRMYMFQTGFWNMFDGSDISKDEMKVFKSEHPDNRVFQYWGASKATKNFNDIAQENSKGAAVDMEVLASNNYEKINSSETANKGLKV